MTRTIRWQVPAGVTNSLALVLLLSTIYPTVFALSNNWYSVGEDKLLWLLGASLVAALLMAAIVELVVALARLALRLARVEAADAWTWTARATIYAILSAAVLFILLDGTLLKALGSSIAVRVAFVLSAAGAVWLFMRRRQRYVSGLLAVLIFASGLGWLWSWAEVKVWAPASAKFLVDKAAFEQARFVERPNIYLFIYDAYGSRDVYEKVFNFDNSAHYRALEERRFRIVHTFSNYYATWPTTLGVFIGAHHYYRMSQGVDDTKLGRSIMAGLARNPVLETLRGNGYRVQYVHGSDYFVNEQGTLDFLFPQEPLYGALRVYGSPLFNRIVGRSRQSRSLDEQKSVLLSRANGEPGPDGGPWFTFAHVVLPSHGPTDKSWLQLKDFERIYVARTVRANAHSLEMIDRIRAKDPNAIIVIFGDHGAKRYRKVWLLDADPNRAFERAGVSPETIALDLFGAMIAIRSNGRCDDYIQPSITPVNIMPTIFACLARDRGLLEQLADDISIFPGGKTLFLVARDGQPLRTWEPMQRP
jgi:hypothetical protein